MIHVLYNALHLTGSYSGVQHTEEQLMKTALLYPHPEIHFEALCPKEYRPDFPAPSHSFIHADTDVSRRWKRIGYEHLRMHRHLPSGSAHLLHCPAYILPWNRKGLNVVTVHDTIAPDFPEYCSTANRVYFRIALPRSIGNATKIIAVSETVKRDLLRRFPVSPEQIEVIYHGLDAIFNEAVTQEKFNEVRQKYGLPEKFILFVGNIEPKKNIARLINAYLDVVRQAGIPHSLVIAGKFAWKYGDVRQKLSEQKDGQIVCPGYIAQSDLPAVYALADLFVFPSLYEGFGLPPLEAMACGTPVIVSSAGALPEISAGHALPVDPLSTDSIGKAMYRMLHEPSLRNRFIETGRLHAHTFRWKKAWQATSGLYYSLYQEFRGKTN
jgi:glycosyltransferase involved in cell wall biosynthesis